MKVETHKLSVLKQVHENEPLTASQIAYSNANQYLIPLERAKLIIRKWSYEGKKRFKLATINREKLDEVKKILRIEQ